MTETAVTVVGIDIGKNAFHVVGLDHRGAIVLRQKWSRRQVESRFANRPPCLRGDRMTVQVCCTAQVRKWHKRK